MSDARAKALLDWYAAMGADEPIGALPVDRFQASAPKPAGAEKPAPAPRPAIVGAHDAAAAEACATIKELAQAIAAFEGCPLKKTATRTVVYDGNPAARLMLIGEAPGAEEDRRGLPFVGAAGKLLDRMLAAIGLDRGGVYITNAIFWRPPGNRAPTPEEIGLCLPFVERQIALVQPAVLVFVGGIAAKAMLGRSEGITKLRGHWYRLQPRGLSAPVDATATFHPAYLLRQPAQKREAWRDLLAIRARLDEHATT
ncbi:MAG: uracil-DNA glycosylase [Alphaproteobacteria bacterium]